MLTRIDNSVKAKNKIGTIRCRLELIRYSEKNCHPFKEVLSKITKIGLVRARGKERREIILITHILEICWGQAKSFAAKFLPKSRKYPQI